MDQGYPTLTASELRELNLKRYVRGIIIAVDQLGNAIFAGAPDETISSRLHREDIVPLIGSVVRYVLNSIEKDHTGKSHEFDDLGLPDAHHLPLSLGIEALALAMQVGDAYLKLPEPTLKMAEQAAKLQRLRENGMVNCSTCGRYI